MTPSHPILSRTYPTGGCVRDLSDDRELARCVALGLLASMPNSAARRAAQRIADGTLPDPGNLPREWAAYIEGLRRDWYCPEHGRENTLRVLYHGLPRGTCTICRKREPLPHSRQRKVPAALRPRVPDEHRDSEPGAPF